MTAEIIVKNPVACALAADSAMTMTGGNSGTVKIFNNAEKYISYQSTTQLV
ncbi:hypothetical protein ACSQOD_000977 [Klebsiella pneumoniae]